MRNTIWAVIIAVLSCLGGCICYKATGDGAIGATILVAILLIGVILAIVSLGGDR